jgi:hypothetical protein
VRRRGTMRGAFACGGFGAAQRRRLHHSKTASRISVLFVE